MRHIPSKPARVAQTFSEPFRAGFDLSSMGLGIIALCVSIFFLSTVANAQLQLQRLYTTSNSAQPPTFLLQGNDGNFYGTMGNASQGSVFKMTPSGAVTNF